MTGITNQSSAQGIFSNLAQALARGNQTPYMAPVAPAAPVANGSGSPLDGREVSKGPQDTTKPESNSVTQPIGVDYSIFRGGVSPGEIGGNDGGTNGEGGTSGVGGNASAGNSDGPGGVGGGYTGGPVSSLATGGPVYKNIPSIDNREMAAHLAAQGRRGDTTLVHMKPNEVQALGKLHPSGHIPVNPNTGLPEANFLTDILPGIAGTVLGTAVGMPWLGAVTAGLGTFATSGNLGKGILSGLMSFGLGSLGGMLGSAGEAAAGAATGAAGEAGKVASEAGVKSAMDLAAQGAPSALDPTKMISTSAIDRSLDKSLGSVAGNGTGLADKFSQGFQNLPQKMSNIFEGAVNPSQWTTDMIKPAMFAGAGLGGLSMMNQQPAAIPNPMAQQQQSQYSGTPSSVPYRTPTGGTVPAGYNPASYPRSAERDWFAPNPAYTGPQISYAEGGQIYSEGGGVFQDGGQYQLARGGVAGLPSGLIRGPGAGMDDKVKGSIDGRRDGYLSDGEYVVDAQTVSALGDGSTEAGAKRMKGLVEEIRQKKFGSKKQPKKMASMGGLASLPFDHLQAGSDGKPVKGGDYRGPGFLEKYFGIGRDEPQDPSRSWSMDPLKNEWPSQEEIDSAREYSRKHGNSDGELIIGKNIPAHGNVRYQGTSANILPSKYVVARERSGQLFDPMISKEELDKETADRLYAAQLLARRSPMGYLGYDIDRMNITPVNDEGVMFTHGGKYHREKDRAWVDTRDRSSAIHEMNHRGMKMLHDSQGFSPEDEENMVRAMMLRHYGDVELDDLRNSVNGDPRNTLGGRQIEKARRMLTENKYFKDALNKAEQLGHYEIAKRNIQKQGSVR